MSHARTNPPYTPVPLSPELGEHASVTTRVRAVLLCVLTRLLLISLRCIYRISPHMSVILCLRVVDLDLLSPPLELAGC